MFGTVNKKDEVVQKGIYDYCYQDLKNEKMYIYIKYIFLKIGKALENVFKKMRPLYGK